MTADDLKFAAVSWLRFDRYCFAVATECGPFNADAFGMTSKSIYEVEVKLSWRDFQADFRKPKHDLYLGKFEAGKYDAPWLPHMFYFMAPEELAKEISNELERVQSPYGVMRPFPWNSGSVTHSGAVIRRAKRFKRPPPQDEILVTTQLRMASEYVTLMSKVLAREAK